MANTTNLNLTKLAGTEKLKTFPSPYNDNMDAIDGAFGRGFGVSGKPSVNAELNSLGDGLAIIANGNTHAAITSGQFVYVRGHGTLSDGLYVATANVSANGTLSGSNLTADTSGGLNAVNANINGHFGNLGSSSNPVTDLTTIPLNWVGSVTLDASISASGVKRAHSIVKYGSNISTRFNIIAVEQYTNKVYAYSMYDGTSNGWHSLEPDSVLMASSTIIPSNSALSDYETPGVYTVASGASAATISDCPYQSSGGRLEVIGQNSNSSYLRQMYYPTGTVNIYTRNKGSSSWGSWYKTTMEQA